MTFRSTVVRALALALLACGSENGTGADGDDVTGDGADTDVGNDDPADDPADALGPDARGEDALALPDAPRPLDCPGDYWITSVSGRVVDETGEPIEGVKVQLCVRVSRTGRLECLTPADSGPDGDYVIVVPDRDRCQSQAVMRVILPLTDRATTYCRLDLPTDEANLTLDEPFVLFETTPASGLPDEGDATAERTVVFEDGLEVDVVPDRLFLGGNGYTDLASRRLAPDSPGLCFVEPDLALDGLYAFSPEGEVTGDNLSVRIPVTGVSPGATATLYVLGALSCELPDGTVLDEGALHPVGTGVVDGAGQYLEGTGDAGLPCFSWLGYTFE